MKNAKSDDYTQKTGFEKILADNFSKSNNKYFFSGLLIFFLSLGFIFYFSFPPKNIHLEGLKNCPINYNLNLFKNYCRIVYFEKNTLWSSLFHFDFKDSYFSLEVLPIRKNKDKFENFTVFYTYSIFEYNQNPQDTFSEFPLQNYNENDKDNNKNIENNKDENVEDYDKNIKNKVNKENKYGIIENIKNIFFFDDNKERDFSILKIQKMEIKCIRKRECQKSQIFLKPLSSSKNYRIIINLVEQKIDSNLIGFEMIIKKGNEKLRKIKKIEKTVLFIISLITTTLFVSNILKNKKNITDLHKRILFLSLSLIIFNYPFFLLDFLNLEKQSKIIKIIFESQFFVFFIFEANFYLKKIVDNKTSTSFKYGIGLKILSILILLLMIIALAFFFYFNNQFDLYWYKKKENFFLVFLFVALIFFLFLKFVFFLRNFILILKFKNFELLRENLFFGFSVFGFFAIYVFFIFNLFFQNTNIFPICFLFDLIFNTNVFFLQLFWIFLKKELSTRDEKENVKKDNKKKLQKNYQTTEELAINDINQTEGIEINDEKKTLEIHKNKEFSNLNNT